MALYQLDQARLTLELTDESRVGQSEEMVIVATSSDPISKEVFKCQEKYLAHLVRKEDLTVYETGLDTTRVYSSNYPGQLIIPLASYARGPNITYSVVNKTAKQDIPSHWVNKVNETKLIKDFNLTGIIFFHTQVINGVGDDNIIVYIQDSEYRTHVVNCYHVWESDEVLCNQAAVFNHTSKIHSFTTSFFKDGEGYQYFYIIVFQGDRKQVEIIDYQHHERLLNITYLGHQEA